MRPLSLLLLAAVLLAHASTHHGVCAETPKPSDTDNKPATPPPTPAPGTTKPGAPTPPPTPATPPPTPTTPAVTTPAPSNSTTPAPTKATPEPTTEAPATKVVPIEAPEATPSSNDATTTDAQSDSSSGMGAGAIVGIVLACVGLVAIIAFFVYRHIRARREDAKHYGMDYDASSPPMTVLESSRNNESKMYAMMDAPSTRHARRPTATNNNNATPTDDFVIMTKYATPSSPKFSQNPPQLSPPPFQQEIADFTKSVHNFDKSQPSTEFQSSYRESDTESYAGGASYSGGGSFMNSFDHGVSGFRDTLNSEVDGGNGAEPAGNNTAHWMEAMDEMRDTNDSYAMLEANGSFNSRGSAMRFSTESDFRG